MYSISSHTVQMNGWIALTKPNTSFSDSLFRLGYQCDLIEGEFYSSEGLVRPDVILTSPDQNHSIVTDCKSKTIDEDQLKRYRSVKNDPNQLIDQWVINNVDYGEYEVDTCLSSLSNLTTKDELEPGETAFVHFEHSPSSGFVIRNPPDYEFENDSLRRVFPINGGQGILIPTEFYPYDIYEEDRRALVTSVLQSIMAFLRTGSSFTVTDILVDTHPEWNNIQREKKKEFKREVRKVVLQISQTEVGSYMEKIADSNGFEWKTQSKSVQAIMDRTDQIVDRIVDGMDQTTLDDFKYLDKASYFWDDEPLFESRKRN